MVYNCYQITAGNSAFEETTVLKKVTISDRVSSIPANLFSSSGLSEISLPDSVKSIGERAFYKCGKLTKVDLGKVETIEKDAFGYASGLKELSLPETVSSIGQGAFDKASALETLYFNCKNVSLYHNATDYFLSQAESLRILVIGETVETIPESAFCKSSVGTVFVNANDFEITSNAFTNCTGLDRIFFAGDNYSFANDAFSGSTGDFTIFAPLNSNALTYAVDKGVSYEALDPVTNSDVLDMEACGVSVKSASSISGFMDLQVDYALADARTDLSDGVLSVFLGDSITLIDSTYTKDAEGFVAIPVTEASGELHLQANSSALVGKQGVYAKLSSASNGFDEILGTVNVGSDLLTLQVPESITNTILEVKGIASADTDVTIKIDDSETVVVHSDKLGSYAKSINIGARDAGTELKVTAEVTYESTPVTVEKTVICGLQKPELTKFDFDYHVIDGSLRTLDVLNCKDQSLIYVLPSMEYGFHVKFDNCKSIDRVYVVSVKNGTNKYIELSYNAELGEYYTEGYFDNDSKYIPGSMTVFYTEKEDRIDISQIDPEDDDLGSQYLGTKEDLPEWMGTSLENEDYIVKKNDSSTFELAIPIPKENPGDTQTYASFYAHNLDLTKTEDAAEARELFALLKEANGRYTKAASNTRSSRVLPLNAVEGEPDLKDWLVNDGIEIAEGIYSADVIDGDSVKTIIYNTVEDRLTEYIVDCASTITGLPVSDMYDFSKNLQSGNYAKIVKKYVSKQMGIKTSTLETGLKVGGKFIVYTTQLRRIYESNLPEEEKQRQMKELDNAFGKDLAFIAIDVAATYAKEAGIKMMLSGNVGVGLAVVAAAVVASDYIDWYQNEYDGDGNVVGEYLAYHLKKLKIAIDPSGIVYEAVTDGYLSGVKATIYYKDSLGQEQTWTEANEYRQQSEITTLSDGGFAWDVPEGTWRVKFEKEGYTSIYSEWMDVPPEQTGLKIFMKSTSAPKRTRLEASESQVGISFSQYMDPDSLAGIQILDSKNQAVSYRLEYDNSHKDVSGKTLAKDFRFVSETLAGGKYTLCLPGTVTSYNGQTVAAENIKFTIDHNFTGASFNWAEDGKSATVTLTCACSHSETYAAKISSQVKTAATCLAMGVTRYTASYGKYTDSKEVADIAKAEHSYDAGVVTKKPTYDATGVKTYTCTSCGNKKTEEIARLVRITVFGYNKIACGKKTSLKASERVTWKSGNTKYATVSSSGLVTTKKAGAGKSVYIYALAKDGRQSAYKITILKHAVSSIKLKAVTSLKVGKTISVKATIKATGSSANKTLVWKSSNIRYATVDNKGKVKALKTGKGKTVTITARATDGSGKYGSIKIKIK